MGDYGKIFGWLIIVGVGFSVLNYPIKLISRRWISRLDRESVLRKSYMMIQKPIVKYHRYFAAFASLMMIIHLIVQLQYRWLSTTGVVAAGLLVLNGFVGGYGHYVKKKKKSLWLYIHRFVAFLAVVSIVVHIVLRGR